MPYVATMPKISEDQESLDGADTHPEVPSGVPLDPGGFKRNYSAVQLKTLRSEIMIGLDN